MEGNAESIEKTSAIPIWEWSAVFVTIVVHYTDKQGFVFTSAVLIVYVLVDG